MAGRLPIARFRSLCPLFGDRAELAGVAGIDARGFVLASVMAYQLDRGLILVRKEGRLPAQCEGESYDLEYGTARLEIHSDAVKKGQRVLIIDDLLATGGSAAATARILERLGATVAGFGFMIELKGLNGRKALGDNKDVFSLLTYD